MKAAARERMTAALARTPARQLHLLFGGVLAIVAALMWTVAVRAPLAQLRVQQAEQVRMTQSAADPAQLARQLAALRSEVAALEQSMAASALANAGAGLASANPAQLQLRLIALVERSAAGHGVRLRSAIPVAARRVAGFDEVAIDVEATASYQALLAWMAEAESGPLAVVSFDTAAGESADARTMKIRLAAYLAPKESK